jgi:epoxyqueuosine reductase
VDAPGLAREVCLGLERKGYPCRIVSIRHIADLRTEIKCRHEQGDLNELFYHESLSGFEFNFAEDFPKARSIIITSAPQPQQKARFQFQGRAYAFTVPPTYSHWTDQLVEKAIMDVLEPSKSSIYKARLPGKLLAVRSGLAKYGKNNITYVDGLGSFHRLKAFLSDIPATEDSWAESEMMEQCRTCSACVKKCPTNAILSDRFLIRAERCLTFHNERQAEFPDWINPAWHNCLIGCMVCQLACPANKGLRDWFVEGEKFTEEETELLWKGISSDRLPQSTAAKVERLGLLEDVGLVSRNLKVLLSQH